MSVDPGLLPTVTLERCPVCRAPRGRLLFETSDLAHGVPGFFRYERCGGCRSVYQNPRVREDHLLHLYPDAYYTHSAGVSSPALSGAARGLRDRVRAGVAAAVRREVGAPAWGRLLARLRRVRERAFYDLVDPAIPRSESPGRALEIGPGSGEGIELLQRAGWETEGIEWDPVAARVAGARSDRPVRVGDFRTAELEEGAYDLVYLSHVLEHLPDPAAAVRRIGSLLRPTGRAVLLFPNPRALGAVLYGSSWHPWDPPRHLVLPSIAGLRGLAREEGLEMSARTRGGRAVWAAWSRRRRRGLHGGGSTVRMPDRLVSLLETAASLAGLRRGGEVVAVLRNGTAGPRGSVP